MTGFVSRKMRFVSALAGLGALVLLAGGGPGTPARGAESGRAGAVGAGAPGEGVAAPRAGGAAAAAQRAGGAAAAAQRADGADSIVLFHTNDVHSHLEPLARGGGEPRGGAAARAALLARERDGVAASLTLDAGDVFEGTAYYNFFRGVPDYRLMNAMGYDAGEMGNHELSHGPAGWLAVRGAARFP